MLRAVHHKIRDRIDRALGPRSWAWLSRASGVPQSTLASQRVRPKFSIEVLLAVAEALERPVTYFLDVEDRRTTDERALDEIEASLRRARIARRRRDAS